MNMKERIRSLVANIKEQWMSGNRSEEIYDMALLIQELEVNVSELREELMIPKMKKDRKVMTGG